MVDRAERRLRSPPGRPCRIRTAQRGLANRDSDLCVADPRQHQRVGVVGPRRLSQVGMPYGSRLGEAPGMPQPEASVPRRAADGPVTGRTSPATVGAPCAGIASAIQARNMGSGRG